MVSNTLLPIVAAVAFAATPAWAAATRRDDSKTVWATPHDSYSSSVGVLGCKIDTNRVAYWPDAVDCTNICVSLEYQDRKVYLLRIDQSQGAHDVSYDAWNYLLTGYSATKKPTAGGPIAMTTETVDPSNCASLIHTDGHKLPLSAANSMNFLASCLGQADSWVGQNHVLYNILDSICSLGSDQECTLDWPAANQPSCPSTLGVPTVLKNAPVYNIQYPSGKSVLAGSSQQAPAGAGEGDDSNASVGSIMRQPSAFLIGTLSLMLVMNSWLFY